jgi:hypothetical protein
LDLCALAFIRKADELGENRMLTNEFRIAKVQKTLRWFEQDIPLLNMRVKELSEERQDSARKFAAAMIEQTRAELQKLLQQRPYDQNDPSEAPCEPAD